MHFLIESFSLTPHSIDAYTDVTRRVIELGRPVNKVFRNRKMLPEIVHRISH